jgi:AmmeMemoRadiSam system protein A
MEPMSFIELTPKHQQQLLMLARSSLRDSLTTYQMPAVEVNELDDVLKVPMACFVTLTIQGELRGCIGSLEASRPLHQEVIQRAKDAAFNDYRFPNLEHHELGKIVIEISVLTPMTRMACQTNDELLASLNPFHDGLLIKAGRYQATFLPQVWDSLPDAGLFVGQLKKKAGLPVDAWPANIECFRYHVIAFSENG